MEEKEHGARSNENVGLLFGYHKELYKQQYEKPSLTKQCCAVYCERGSVTSWALSLCVGLIIIGTLCTIYGYFLPSLYLSLTHDIDANMTITEENGLARSDLEKEAESLSQIYHDRDAFVIAGLAILFIGGLIMSISLLLPLCIKGGVERIPSSSHITVQQELGDRSTRLTENCLNSYTEESCH